jgi:hypothetical protein
VVTYLKKLEGFCQPDHIIIGGSGTKGKKYDLLEPRLKEVRVCACGRACVCTCACVLCVGVLSGLRERLGGGKKGRPLC